MVYTESKNLTRPDSLNKIEARQEQREGKATVALKFCDMIK